MRVTRLFVLVLLASGHSTAGAGLIVNGDFESQPNFGNPGSYVVWAPI